MRSWRWWLGIGPFPLLLAAFLLSWASCNALGHLRLRAAFSRLEREGAGLRSSDFAPPPVPRERNAGIPYVEWVHRVERPGEPWRFALDTFAYRWSGEVLAEDREEIVAWHDRHAIVIENLVAAGRLPECRAEIDYSLAIDDRSFSLLDLAYAEVLLAVSVRLAHERGSTEEIGGRVLAYWRLHRLPASVPWMLSHAFACSWQKHTLELAGSLLAAGVDLPPEFAEELHAVAENRFRQAFPTIIRADRAQMFEMLVGDKLHRLTGGDDPAKTTASRVVWAAVPFIHGRLNWSLSWYSDAADAAAAACAEDPVSRAWERFPRGLDMMKRAYLRGEFAVLQGQQLTMSIRMGIEADQCIELLKTAVAALAHLKQRGAWPPSIGGRDWFSGRTLLSRIDGDHLVIYSVGRDGIDDDADSEKDLALRLPTR